MVLSPRKTAKTTLFLKADVKRRLFVILCLQIYNRIHLNRLFSFLGPPQPLFHTLKTELVHHHKFENQEEAKKEIFEYIEVFYNQNRMHFANKYLSPKEYDPKGSAEQKNITKLLNKLSGKMLTHHLL